MLYQYYYFSPIGTFELISTDTHLTHLNFCKAAKKSSSKIPNCLKNCIKQLDEYFTGKRTEFDLPISLNGTEFQNKVWRALQNIPFAEIRSYGDLAKAVKSPKGFRAVGMANNRNPIAVIIPCHRVIGADGSMTGYAGGIWRKEWLLDHEKSHALKKSA